MIADDNKSSLVQLYTERLRLLVPCRASTSAVYASLLPACGLNWRAAATSARRFNQRHPQIPSCTRQSFSAKTSGNDKAYALSLLCSKLGTGCALHAAARDNSTQIERNIFNLFRQQLLSSNVWLNKVVGAHHNSPTVVDNHVRRMKDQVQNVQGRNRG